jgi:predicted site-specific integrase-resolvase
MQTSLMGYAKIHGVSRQTVYAWIAAKRIKAKQPRPGVWMIDEEEPRPKPMTPWQRKHEEDSVYST